MNCHSICVLSQPVALVVKLVYSFVFEEWGPDVAHGVQCALLVLGLVCVASVPKKYRRREAEEKARQDAIKDSVKDAPLENGQDNGVAPEAVRLTAVD